MSKASRYPLIEEIDLKSSMLDAFELFRNEAFSFFLDSGMDPHKLGRYSFIGSTPFLVMNSRSTEITLSRGAEKSRLSA